MEIVVERGCFFIRSLVSLSGLDILQRTVIRVNSRIGIVFSREPIYY